MFLFLCVVCFCVLYFRWHLCMLLQKKNPKKWLKRWKCETSHVTWHSVSNVLSLVLNMERSEDDWFVFLLLFLKTQKWAQRKCRDQIVCRLCLKVSYWPTGVKETRTEQRPSLVRTDSQTSASVFVQCTLFYYFFLFKSFVFSTFFGLEKKIWIKVTYMH